MERVMKRTLMLKNQELFDFEVDTATEKIRILDAPEPGDALLASLGFDGPDGKDAVAGVVKQRHISSGRDDIDQIRDAFGVQSVQELTFRGHGLSLSDKLWYRAPGSFERWEDINFFDNDWDNAFGKSILTRDYKGLASCSPDVPEVTTGGHLRKAWERSEGRIQLLKEPLFQNEYDLEGARLASELCRQLYGQDAYQPLYIVERFGQRFSASPLMIGRDEELVQGLRLFSMGGFSRDEAGELMGSITPQSYVDVMARVGVPDAVANTAKIFAFKTLSLLADMHAGNFGIIRNIETGALRSAPPFDYDRAFGFPSEEYPIESLCGKPQVAAILCAYSFSDLDSAWDWSWYDPQALEGFEERIIKAYAHYTELPPNFGELVAQLFIMQRNYVNEVISEWQQRA